MLVIVVSYHLCIYIRTYNFDLKGDYFDLLQIRVLFVISGGKSCRF